MGQFLFDLLQSIIQSWVGLYAFIFSILYMLYCAVNVWNYYRDNNNINGLKYVKLLYCGITIAYVITYLFK